MILEMLQQRYVDPRLGTVFGRLLTAAFLASHLCRRRFRRKSQSSLVAFIADFFLIEIPRWPLLCREYPVVAYDARINPVAVLVVSPQLFNRLALASVYSQ